MDTELGKFLGSIPVEERVGHYVSLAEEALQKAATMVDIELRAQYLNLAKGWMTLAHEVQQMLGVIDTSAAQGGTAALEEH